MECVYVWLEIFLKSLKQLSKFYAIFTIFDMHLYLPPCVWRGVCVYLWMFIHSQTSVTQIILFWYTILFRCVTLNVWLYSFWYHFQSIVFTSLFFSFSLAVKLIYFWNAPQNQYQVCKFKRLCTTFALNGSFVYFIETLYKYICSTE